VTRRGSVALGLEIAVPLAALAIWWVASSDSDSVYFPPLSDILDTFADTWLFERAGTDLAPSLARLITGFALAVVIGIGGGLLLGVSAVARRATAPIVEFLRAIPPPALIPAAIVVLGVGDGMKVLIITMACVWPILLNAIDGVASVDPTLLETSRSYGIRPLDRLRSVVLPAALPQIFAGMRTSLSIAIIVMVVSEMVASTNGVGFFVLESQSSFAITEMWSGILLLGILGYVLNLGFTRVERHVLRWHRGARESALAET
jgi:ABC-type nitrate/sulfonate/bicarbonate transport system permease component